MNLRRDWNQFWFSTIPSGPLGLFRIAMGFLILACGFHLYPDRNTWFSDRGLLTGPDSLNFRAHNTAGPRHIDFLYYVHHDWMLTLFFVVYLAASLCMTIGLWTRPAIFLVWIGMNCWHNRDPVLINSGDCVMLAMTIYLLLAPSGASCSVDRLIRVLRGKEGDRAPKIVPWAQRLMQLQVSLIYCCTFIGKCAGALWQNGTAAYYPLQLQEFHRFPVPPLGLNEMWLINLLTYGTLIIEFMLVICVWIPRMRLYALTMGVLLHLGIEYSLNIPFFSFLMIASYISFLETKDIKNFTLWLSRQLKFTPLRLVYDGECDFCRSALLVFHYFDVFEKIKFLNYHNPEELSEAAGVVFADADQGMIAVDSHDRQYPGFYAFRQIVGYLPAFWLLIPFLYIPGVPFIGKRIYSWVVKNRSRLPVAPRIKSMANS